MQELAQVEVREEVRVLALEQVLLRAREISLVELLPTIIQQQAAAEQAQQEQAPPADHVEQVE